MNTLRQKQINAIKQMLNLNQPQQSKLIASEPVWKVLVYDKLGQDIISPLLSVKELHELGVTLFVQLHSDRDPIPEVPAIYFCQPNEDNLGRIGQDFQKGLYDIYHLNFISAISRQKLEDLASAAIQTSSVANIHKVYDQYVNFITLEDDLFCLKHQNSDMISYYAINRGDMKDWEMDSMIDQIVDCLFSVFVTLGVVPIIRSPKNNAAEMVARRLDKKLRDNVFDSRNNLFQTTVDPTSNSFNFHRPLLVILDRNIDMATPLHHTWTYQALAHDLLNLSLNRVVIDDSTERGGTRHKSRICELDARDKFWMSQKGSPFPTVAEAIQEELESYRNSEDEVKQLKTSMGLEGDETDIAMAMVSDNTTKLTNAVNSLPQLLEKKRLIDMHTSIATAILNKIKARKLDTLFELEEKIMSKAQNLDRLVMDAIQNTEVGTAEDKVRLYLIYYICMSISDSEAKRLEEALQNIGCDLTPVTYIKRWKSYSKLATSSNQYEGAGTKTVSMFSKLMSQGSNFVMEGVKNLVIKRHNLPLTKIVDHLMELRHISEMDEYHHFDPKQLKMTETALASHRNRQPFQECIVFVVGGGNYMEYQNLCEYAKQKTGKRIIYGASTLNNGCQFLKQLSLLGQEISS